jgi:monoamine oxidase
MSEKKNSPTITKREFLHGVATIGGASAAYVALNAWGLGSAAYAATPPELDGSGRGKKVVILGAGMAGMTTAYELSQRGYQVKILEARGFSGGRCQTARSGHQWTDINGNTHECTLDRGQYFNHGPWRIPSDHTPTLHYTRKFNVPMEVMVNYNEDSYLRYANAQGGLKGKRVRRREVMADMRGNTAELLAKVIDQGQLDANMDSESYEKLLEYLVREGHLDQNDLVYNSGFAARGTTVDSGFGSAVNVPSDPYLFQDLIASGLGNSFNSVSSKIMFQPVGGMDQIAMAFDKEIGRRITHNAEVLEIRQDENGVRIPYKNTRSGNIREETADYCVSTIPPTIISKLPLDLSDECKTALSAPSGNPVSKLGLQMNRRFWEEDDNIYGGGSNTDTPLNSSLSYPSQDMFSDKGVLLAGYHFGGGANQVGAMSSNERVELALKNGELVHPGQFRKHYANKFNYKGWHLTKYSQGGWENWSSDAKRDLYPLLAEPQGRVYFAGSYTTNRAGWLSGAIVSAWHQVEQLHKMAMTS